MTSFDRFDFGRVRRYPVRGRKSKVTVQDLAYPLDKDSVSGLLDSLPDILAARDLRLLVNHMLTARKLGKPVIWGFGGHVIKVGLGPLLIHLMSKGFVTALATNGSGIVHDFELGLWGKTSEDVQTELTSGAFGMAEETGRLLNQSISEGVEKGCGLGEAVGRFLVQNQAEFSDYSVISQAFKRGVPLCVHIALGTDIFHCHPEASGEILGEASFRDFQIFTQQVSQLNDGGVYLNVGSAVILPEVFLKAVSVVRSAGLPLKNFTSANLDFIQHYRPTENVVRRPVLGSGKGISLTGHHEIMIPLLAGLLLWGRNRDS